jgi:hypothetical protein
MPARATGRDSHVYRLGKVPRPLLTIGERLEPRFGRLGKEYAPTWPQRRPSGRE